MLNATKGINYWGKDGKGKPKKLVKVLKSQDLFSVFDGKVKPSIEITCSMHGKQNGKGKVRYVWNSLTITQ